ncbi:MAG: hypothetical protein IPP88_18455 [Betaproteobacteria bacterium]|nr:hypothetical protein [Betaproteobacteria bacterium]
MAPGLNVGQISSNSWAVSSRGVNGRFTNKLLVLMDGRSVYAPTFPVCIGMFRIRCSRTSSARSCSAVPGHALGANAGNGVINIITKSAAATVGGKMTVGAGSEARGSASIRYGGELGDMGHWRAYAKGFDRDGSVVEATGAAGQDTWRQQRAGFRTDLAAGNIDKVTLQGDYYTGRSGDTSMLNFLTPPFNVLAQTSQKVSGGNLLGRWQRDISATDTFTVQTYIDHIERDWPAHVKEKRDTFDLDFQYRTRRFAATIWLPAQGIG